MEISKRIADEMQRLVDDLRIEVEGLEARGGPGDAEKAKKLRIELSSMQAKFEGVPGYRRETQPQRLSASGPQAFPPEPYEANVSDSEALRQAMKRSRRSLFTVTLAIWFMRATVVLAILAMVATVVYVLLPIVRPWLE